MEAAKVLRALKEEKPKLEEKYCVRIWTSAFKHAVVHCLDSSNSKLVSEGATVEKAVQILEGACELVLERFRNCDYQSEFYEKAYELRRALVDVIELYRDNHPDSQSWLTWVKWERDRASIYMSDFLDIWRFVVNSTGLFGILSPEYADKVRWLKSCASKIALLDCPLLNKGSSAELTTATRRAPREIGCCLDEIQEIGCFLDDIQGQLIRGFESFLTVKPCHVAEVVSSLTDVPITEILPSISHLKETAIYKTNQRVANQEHVIDEIFKILVCHKHMTARPRGLFLLLGSSGTGKTEIAKAVAEHWYCDVSRLVEIDMSEYAQPELESTSCDVAAWSKRKHEDFWNRLSEVVRKRPYSVILLDKIDKAAFSVMIFLREVLSNDALSDIEGNAIDFSKSIIFMTSSVGVNQLSLACTCFNQNRDLWKQFRHNPIKFDETHNCSLKGSGRERVLIEARKFFGADLLDALDKVFVLESLGNRRAVSRMLLRGIVREVCGGRFVVHISDAALDVILTKAWTKSSKAGNAIKESLLEHVIPRLSEAGHNSVGYVDSLVGTHELSFRFETHKMSLDDWYFKQKNGTFDALITGLRMKVQSVYKFFELRKKCLDHSGRNFYQLGEDVSAICNLILMCPPFPNPLLDYVFEEGAARKVAPDNLPMVEEKEKIKNVWRRLQEIDTGLAKATRIIVDAVVKIIDAPLQLPDSPARYYLFLCLDDHAKIGLINCLIESLRTNSGKSFFRHVRLNSNCRGEELKELLIQEVNQRPCTVFLLDGVEYADAVLYRSLLEIFDRGTLDDGEGFTVDFRRTIVILTSEVANKPIIASLFDYQPYVLHNMAMNQNVKRFRTELLHRVDEIIFFDPILPEHGGILRLPKRDGCYMKKPDSRLLSAFLFKMFDEQQPLPDQYEELFDQHGVSQRRGSIFKGC